MIMVIFTPKENYIMQDFLKYILQMHNVSTFGNTADTYAIVRLVPHTCRHVTVVQSHSSGNTVVKILKIRGSGGTKTIT
jgi:hypothetical protein